MISRKNPLRHASLWHAAAWISVIAIVYLSLARSTITLPGMDGDKYSHVLAYAVVTFGFMQIYHRGRSRIAVAAALFAMGVGLEFVQLWTGYRAMEGADMVADAVGIAVGWIAGPPRTYRFIERDEKLA